MWGQIRRSYVFHECERVSIFQSVTLFEGIMKNHVLLSLMTTTSVVLCGCAVSTRNSLVRPSEGELIVGESSRADVIRRLGKPGSVARTISDGRQLDFATYDQSGGRAARPGVVPVRCIKFTFFNDKLVSQMFTSSFKEDSTDFDETKVASISKGQSKIDDVIALLGRPSGERVYPIIKGVEDRDYLYIYVETKGARSIKDMKTLTKRLVVSVNSTGTVTNIEYDSKHEDPPERTSTIIR
jgi:outer membrane protein assembly factor BamE (lipoprotein component of BamABCDE complex)